MVINRRACYPVVIGTPCPWKSFPFALEPEYCRRTGAVKDSLLSRFARPWTAPAFSTKTARPHQRAKEKQDSQPYESSWDLTGSLHINSPKLLLHLVDDQDADRRLGSVPASIPTAAGRRANTSGAASGLSAAGVGGRQAAPPEPDRRGEVQRKRSRTFSERPV